MCPSHTLYQWLPQGVYLRGRRGSPWCSLVGEFRRVLPVGKGCLSRCLAFPWCLWGLAVPDSTDPRLQAYAYDSASLVTLDSKLKAMGEENVVYNFHPYMGPDQAGDHTKCPVGFETHVENIFSSESGGRSVMQRLQPTVSTVSDVGSIYR